MSSSRTRPMIGALLAVLLVVAGLAYLVLGDDEALAPSAPPAAQVERASAPVLPPALEIEAPEGLLPAVEPVSPRAAKEAETTTDTAREAHPSSLITRSVLVTVVDADGRPVADAQVESFEGSSADLPHALARQPAQAGRDVNVHEAKMARIRADLQRLRASDPTWNEPDGTWTTNAAGEARIEVASTSAEIVGSHPELGTSGAVAVATIADGTTFARLSLAPREWLRGVVLDVDGRPAVGAVVTFEGGIGDEGAGRPRMPRPIEVAADGRFEAQVDTPFFATAHAEQSGSSTLEEFVHVSAGSPATLELRFPGAFAVMGVVLGPSGAPQADARVDVAGFSVQVDEVTTDEAGRFRLVLAEPDHVVLFADAKGLVPQAGVAVTLSEGEPPAEIVLRLIQPASIRGRVQFHDGTPVSDARLWVRPSMQVSPEADPAARAEWARRRLDSLSFEIELADHARTGNDGAFEFTEIHPDHAVDLSCTLRGVGEQSAKITGVQPGAQDVLVEFARLAPGQDRLAGRVIDGQSRRAPEHCELVCAYWYGGRVAPFDAARVTLDGGDGRFALSGLDPAREYGLTIEAVGYPSQTFGPYKTGADSDIELVVGRHAALVVLVTDAEGRPQPGASVALIPGVQHGFDLFSHDIETRQASAEGVVLWKDLTPSACTLEAVSGALRSPRTRVVPAPGSETTVHLIVRASDATGALELVATLQDGSPWRGAEVTALLQHDDAAASDLASVYGGKTDDNGRALLQGLPAGSYLVFVRSKDAGGITRIARSQAVGDGMLTLRVQARD